jgi:hypothetical protein
MEQKTKSDGQIHQTFGEGKKPFFKVEGNPGKE